MGMQLGYTMMTEQAGPKDLVRHVVGAEAVGFDFSVSSDHYFPWLDEMGHSPNAWVTLGAAAQATSRIPLMTYVTCPTFRYHPAVVAQQAATLQILADGQPPPTTCSLRFSPAPRPRVNRPPERICSVAAC